MSADFSAETLQARREWQNISDEREKPTTKIYPARISFRFGGEKQN